MNQKKNVFILIVAAVIIAIGGVLWYVQREVIHTEKSDVPIDQTVEIDAQDNENTQEGSQEGTADILYNEDGSIDTSNWQTYRNEEYGFELKYPENWIANEGVKYPTIKLPGAEFSTNNTSYNLVSVIFSKNQKEFSSMIQDVSCKNPKCTVDELKRSVALLCGIENNVSNVDAVSVADGFGYICVFKNELLGEDALKKVVLFQNSDDNFYVIEFSGVLDEVICNKFLDEFILL